jgi:hypothetical protein
LTSSQKSSILTSTSPFDAESHFLEVFGKENRMKTVSEERKKKKTRKRKIRKIKRIVNHFPDFDIDLHNTRNYYPSLPVGTTRSFARFPSLHHPSSLPVKGWRRSHLLDLDFRLEGFP